MTALPTEIFVNYILHLVSLKHIYLICLRENNFLSDGDEEIKFTPPPFNSPNREVTSRVIATLTQRDTAQVEDWAIAGLVTREIRRPQYTSHNYPPVPQAVMSTGERRSYG